VVSIRINGFKCGVMAVIYCLCCLAFSLARLLSKLNHAKTPNLYPCQWIYIKGIGAPIGRSSVGISTRPINLAWRLVLAKRYIIWILSIFLITLLGIGKLYRNFITRLGFFMLFT